MGEFPDEICKVSTNKWVILLPTFLVARSAMENTAAAVKCTDISSKIFL